MDIYVYFSDGTDNGKTFTSIEEAMKYLYQQAHHSKVHLDGILKDMRLCSCCDNNSKYSGTGR